MDIQLDYMRVFQRSHILKFALDTSLIPFLVDLGFGYVLHRYPMSRYGVYGHWGSKPYQRLRNEAQKISPTPDNTESSLCNVRYHSVLP